MNSERRALDSAVWRYYGMWRSPSSMLQEPRPAGAIPVAGWAVRRVASWGVLVGDLELDLLVSGPEIDFLSQCCDAQGYSCWVSGLAVMTRRTKLMVPDDLAVYNVRANAEDAFAPPSAAFARTMAENSRTWTLFQTWGDILRHADVVRSRRVVHPLALRSPPERPLGDHPEVSIGFVFASHMQAEAQSGSSRFCGSSVTYLGTSGVGFDHGTGLCVPEDKGDAVKHCVPRGCMVVADSAKTLLLVANGASHACEGSLPCLVVAAREALSALARALGDLGVTVADSARALRLATGDTQACPRATRQALVLASSELVAKHLPYLRGMQWGRVILCDWARAGAALVRALRGADVAQCTFVPCQVQITLAVAEDIERAPARAYNIQELALFLGLPAELLGCPNKLRALLCEKVLRVEDDAARDAPRVRRYDLVRLTPPTEEEVDDASRSRGFQKQLHLMLGPLATAGRDHIGVLPETQTIREYFAQRGREHSGAFVDSSFGAAAENTKTCPLCLDESDARAVTCCGHWFCPRCIARALSTGFRQCPVCREPLPDPRDVVVGPSPPQPTTFLDQLAAAMNELERRAQKFLLVTPFASCLERVARQLRWLGLNTWAWSGNAKQLQRNLSSFQACEGGSLLSDPAFLPLRWLDLGSVKHVLVVLPLNPEHGEVCCQLRETLLQTPDARITFLLGSGVALPSESPSCDGERRSCPFLVEQT
jgi:hypothetical protein